ncbi:TonB-dependent siderophore receptor [Pelistega sp. NLN82]|uniref:TonB-dependent siderophore receptor n=1 Tax=Pelistega ratti TaxID=2652177 RepID=A0A6L9Y4B3_9BURK|nr:TonB-dependent siderophore receptor [Pelistega ratti]NEN75310.1 TonB-dependent siderophore receptor [Pelistega ratti]
MNSYHKKSKLNMLIHLALLGSVNVAIAQDTVVLSAIDVITNNQADLVGGQLSSEGNLGFLGSRGFKEIPFNTVSYTNKYIEDRQAKDITDVIASTDASVFTNATSGGWNENYWIRGFNTSSSDMTVNGLIGFAPFYRATPEMYERVEVLKGPSALLNGMPPKGSVGGTVNLVTKRAGDEPLTRLTTTYMSDSQFGGHIDFGRRFGQSKQFGIRINGVYRDGNGAVKKQEKKTELLSLALDWRGDKTRLSADLYYSNDKVIGVSRGVRLSPNISLPKPPKADTLLNADWSYVQTKDKGILLRAEYDITKKIMAYITYGKSKTKYAYNGTGGLRIIKSDGTYESIIPQLEFDLERDSSELGLKANFSTGSINHQLVTNMTYYSDIDYEYGNRGSPSTRVIGSIYRPIFLGKPAMNTLFFLHTRTKLKSIGIADTLSFYDDKIQLTLGLRHQQIISNSYSVRTGAKISRYDKSALTPGIAFSVKLTDDISLYGNYIEGLTQGGVAPFNAANAGEIFKPMKTKQKELGIKVSWGNFLHTLSAFEIKKPNEYLDTVTNIYSQNGEQKNRGVEWSFTGTVDDDIRLIGGITYLDGKLTKTGNNKEKDKQIIAIPKLQAKLGVEWDVPWVSGLTLTGNMTAMSKQYLSADHSSYNPGRSIYDVGARYSTKLAGRPFVVRATVNNLTNKSYWGVGSLSYLTLGAPRTFMLSASMDF